MPGACRYRSLNLRWVSIHATFGTKLHRLHLTPDYIAPHVTQFTLLYLGALRASALHTLDDRTIKEHGEVCGMIIGMEIRSKQKKTR
jgi:hypothetical protein